MIMRISFLHTAQVHVQTFDAIFKTLDPSVELHHHVAPELLENARAHGVDSVRAETIDTINRLTTADAVVCTCSTLGPIADTIKHPHILRIDRPVMEFACAKGVNTMVAICLESTRASTLDLLNDCADQPIFADVVLCDSAWPFFENGQIDLFADEIEKTIRTRLETHNQVDCIVLAQASMHVAEPLLQDVYIPLVSSPKMAAMRALEIARGK
jgi:hypothetical protein